MLWEWDKDRSRVYILDLDGTMMPSAEIDNDCFWDAVFACFGNSYAIPDLHNFEHVTDTGILNEWCERELGRPARLSEVETIKQDFSRRLECAAHQHPECFNAFPGLVDWLQAVQNCDHVFAGIATGGWRHSARLKLRLSGLDRFELPLASSDDAVSRVDIMNIAAKQICCQIDNKAPDITYLGDRLWDLQASQTLEWRFIGIANGLEEEQLRRAGATQVCANFLNSQ